MIVALRVLLCILLPTAIAGDSIGMSCWPCRTTVRFDGYAVDPTNPQLPPGVNCPANSTFQIYSDRTYGSCVCSQGYWKLYNVEACNRTLSLGESCNLQPFSDRNGPADEKSFIDPCDDHFSELECRDEQCKCREGLQWNGEDKICYSRWGCTNFLRVESDGVVGYDETDNRCVIRRPNVAVHVRPGFPTTAVNCKPGRSKLVETQLKKDGKDKIEVWREIRCDCEPGLEPLNGHCVVPKQKGDLCPETRPDELCNPKERLTCLYRRCQCKGGDSVWNASNSTCDSEEDCHAIHKHSNFDPELNTCVMKLGQSSWDAPMSSDVVFPCPKNSKYQEYSGCSCDEGFIELNDKCVQVAGHGETCQTRGEYHSNCRSLVGLVCLRNTCQCRGGTWNEELNKCAAGFAEPCSTSNSVTCSTKNADCTEGRCQCHAERGYQYFRDVNACQGQYKARCALSEDCAGNLNCLNGNCVCGKLLTEKYNSEARKCVSAIGSPCATDSTTCPPYSTCVDGECRCPAVSAPTADGFGCRPALSHNEYCFPGLKQGGCDYAQGLGCINRNCTCVDTDLQFLKGVGCLASNGVTCGWVNEQGESFGSIVDDREPADAENVSKYRVGCAAPLVCRKVTWSSGGAWRCQGPSVDNHNAETPSA